MLRLAAVVLAVSAAFAFQIPSGHAVERTCRTDRNCPRDDFCRIIHPGTHHGVCVRRRHDAAPVDGATPTGPPTPPSGASQMMCPMIYQPVCGVDGKTYPNQCHATRAGVSTAHTGAC